MNKFEEVVVGDIATIKTETKNCQKACLERHDNLNVEVDHMKQKHEDLKNQLFDPKEGVITMITMAQARQSVVTAISSFVGTTLGILILGYVFSKVAH